MVKAPRQIPDAVRATQARASDPASSAFVSANAGSGKTHVLVQRVIRLLLDGVPPEKILCITFTKAAAANMAERVFSTLGHWSRSMIPGSTRRSVMQASRVPMRSEDARPRAVRLRARDAGGLKVQTIHALCTRLLQQFPFEANVPARFTVLDERDQNEMMERANLAVLLDASRDPDSAAGRALNIAMASAADVTFKDVVREACLSRDRFMAWTDGAAAPMPRRSRSLSPSASTPVSGSKTSNARLSTDRTCRDRGGGKSPQSSTAAANPIPTRRVGFAKRWYLPASNKWTNISACSHR